jgi:hypothetical protein
VGVGKGPSLAKYFLGSVFLILEMHPNSFSSSPSHHTSIDINYLLSEETEVQRSPKSPS